jgi:hypothetical protein
MNYNKLAPIVLFVYNRPWHTKQTLEALAKNDLANESTLYIIADGPKENASDEERLAIKETRNIIRKEKWCKEIIIEEKESNQGLADSIIEGVTKIIQVHGKIIVLEDDLVTSKQFLSYMNFSLSSYQFNQKVMHISAFLPTTSGQYSLPNTFFTTFMSCWGWGTWADRWKNANWNATEIKSKLEAKKSVKQFCYYGTYPNLIEQLNNNIEQKNKTWAIKWYGTIFLSNGLVLTPKHSLINNIGFDNSGENCTSDEPELYKSDLEIKIDITKINTIGESVKAKRYLKRFYKYGRNSSLLQRIKMNYYWHLKKRFTNGG